MKQSASASLAGIELLRRFYQRNRKNERRKDGEVRRWGGWDGGVGGEFIGILGT